ncbi:MAG: hypothetical protein QXD13_00725 [Candidatus Pacearchaeota archaeon]
MREDILGGLKIALEKGESIQEAAQSFINAGYSQHDVQEAVNALGKVPMPSEQVQPVQKFPSAQIIQPEKHFVKKPEEASKLVVWIIIILLVITLGAIGFLLFRYFSLR